MLATLRQIAQDCGWTIDKYVIAAEAHAEGLGHHYHCYLKFSSKLNLKNPRRFDLHWEDAHYHPNLAGCRSAHAVDEYCKKDGDYISNFYQVSPACD